MIGASPDRDRRRRNRPHLLLDRRPLRDFRPDRARRPSRQPTQGRGGSGLATDRGVGQGGQRRASGSSVISASASARRARSVSGGDHRLRPPRAPRMSVITVLQLGHPVGVEVRVAEAPAPAAPARRRRRGRTRGPPARSACPPAGRRRPASRSAAGRRRRRAGRRGTGTPGPAATVRGQRLAQLGRRAPPSAAAGLTRPLHRVAGDLYSTTRLASSRASRSRLRAGAGVATAGPGRPCRGTARRSPRSASPRRRQGARQRRRGSPARCSICTDHINSRSPSRIAPGRPKAAGRRASRRRRAAPRTAGARRVRRGAGRRSPSRRRGPAR